MSLQYAIAGGTLLDGETGMRLDGETLYRGTATGALSERLVVSEQVALPLGDSGVPLEEAALLGCAALTGVGAVLFAAGVEPGSTVLVVGAGRRRPVRRPGSTDRRRRARSSASTRSRSDWSSCSDSEPRRSLSRTACRRS